MSRNRLQLLLIIPIVWAIWSLVSMHLLHPESLAHEDVPQYSLPSNHDHEDHDPASLTSKTPPNSKKYPPKPLQNNGLSKLDDPKSITVSNTTTAACTTTTCTTTAGFIHMGKTGGSNLARLLRNGCHSKKPKPCKIHGIIANESIVSQLVQDYFHITDDTRHIPHSNHSVFILTSRDVYERFVSAFVYLHPRNKAAFQRHMSQEDMREKGYAYKCFKSLEPFCQYLGDEPWSFSYRNPDRVFTRNCTNLARAIVAGRVMALEHMYNNYQNMLKWIPHQTNRSTFYIIRQEHLWDDWVQVNRMLGQSSSSEIVLPQQRVRRNVTTEKPPPVTKQVSVLGRERLCRALQGEYKAYVTLLRRAKNICEADVQEAIQMGRQACPNLNMSQLEAAA